MSLTPTVPQIAPVQSAAGGLATSDDIGTLLGPIAARANAPLPDPYTQGTQVAEPHYHEHAPQQTNRPTNTAPITGQVADVKRARRQNAVAGLANTVSQASNIIQERKNNKLKDQLTDVMKAKQNIANATSVMQNPTSSDVLKQQAQKVLDANKKQLNTILSDPKTTKLMQKALDISFVDPEKNKTPEVQTYQKALAEFKEAGPFNADNPAEHAVAQAAKSPQEQMKTNPNPVQIPPAPNYQPVPKSQTPYADKALAKDLPSIETNPQYASALAQQQAAQKQLATVIPKLIDAEAKAQLQAAKDNNAAARAQLATVTKFMMQQKEIVAKTNLADKNNQAAMARVASRNANTLLNTTLRVNGALKVAEFKQLNADQAKAIKDNSLKELNGQIASVADVVEKDRANLAQAKTPEDVEQAKGILALDLHAQQGLQGLRELKFSDINLGSESKGTINDNSQGIKEKSITNTGSSDNNSNKAVSQSSIGDLKKQEVKINNEWDTAIDMFLKSAEKHPHSAETVELNKKQKDLGAEHKRLLAEIENRSRGSENGSSSSETKVESVGNSDSDEPEDDSDSY